MQGAQQGSGSGYMRARHRRALDNIVVLLRLGIVLMKGGKDGPAGRSNVRFDDTRGGWICAARTEIGEHVGIVIGAHWGCAGQSAAVARSAP